MTGKNHHPDFSDFWFKKQHEIVLIEDEIYEKYLKKCDSLNRAFDPLSSIDDLELPPFLVEAFEVAERIQRHAENEKITFQEARKQFE